MRDPAIYSLRIDRKGQSGKLLAGKEGPVGRGDDFSIWPAIVYPQHVVQVGVVQALFQTLQHLYQRAVALVTRHDVAKLQ